MILGARRFQAIGFVFTFILLNAIAFQNCTKANVDFGEGDSTQKQNESLFGGNQNGDGYSGKANVYYRYDDNNTCGANSDPSTPVVLSAIEYVNPGFQLIRENCQDIVPRPLAVDDVDYREYNPGFLIFEDFLFQQSINFDPIQTPNYSCLGDAQSVIDPNQTDSFDVLVLKTDNPAEVILDYSFYRFDQNTLDYTIERGKRLATFIETPGLEGPMHIMESLPFYEGVLYTSTIGLTVDINDMDGDLRLTGFGNIAEVAIGELSCYY